MIGDGTLALVGAGVVSEALLLAGLVRVEYTPRHKLSASGTSPPVCDGCAQGRHYPHGPWAMPRRRILEG